MRIAILVLLASVRVAAAYPQFQPGRDITCTGCHLSPDGAGLLNENGRTVLEKLAWKEHASEFMYGKVTTPDWLQLGGDFRCASGLFINHGVSAGAFPMQIDLQARAASHGFSA